MSLAATAVSGLFSLATGWLDNKSEKQKAEKEITKAKVKAAVSAYENHQDDAHEWEMAALDNSGWKDEWFTLLLSVPAVLCFMAFSFWGIEFNGPVVVKNGFDALNQTPEWFQTMFQVAVYASFGIKFGGKTAKKGAAKLVDRIGGKK